MELVYVVVILALVEYMVFGLLVGRARGKYNCPAPAVTGDPVFERYYRVHQNTLEQLVVFIPAILIYGYFGNPTVAALAGLLFLIGRIIYLLGYVRDPAKRGPGFGLGYIATAFLLVAGLVAVLGSLL